MGITRHTSCWNVCRSILSVPGMYHHHHHHHHHHVSVMELGHLLTRSGLTYPGVSWKVYHDSFCQLGSSVSLHWVIYFEVFYLHVSSFSCIPEILSKIGVTFNSFVSYVITLNAWTHIILLLPQSNYKTISFIFIFELIFSQGCHYSDNWHRVFGKMEFGISEK